MQSTALTYRQLSRMFNAIVMLGNRSMANVGADLKVARFIRALQPEAVALAKKREELRAPPAQEDKPALPAPAPEEIARLERALLDERFEVALPLAFRLTEADLPKEKTGADGWKNADGLGAIVADLELLFDLSDEPPAA